MEAPALGPAPGSRGAAQPCRTPWPPRPRRLPARPPPPRASSGCCWSCARSNARVARRARPRRNRRAPCRHGRRPGSGQARAGSRCRPSRRGRRAPPATHASRQARSLRVERAARQLVLDREQTVVLGHTLGARGRAGFDHARACRHREVGDGRVLGLARSV